MCEWNSKETVVKTNEGMHLGVLTLSVMGSQCRSWSGGLGAWGALMEPMEPVVLYVH